MLYVFSAREDAHWEAWDIVGIESNTVRFDLDVDNAIPFDFDEGMIVTKCYVFWLGRRLVVCDGVEEGWV